MTPPTKDNHPTLSFREMTEEQKERLLEDYKSACDADDVVLEYKDKTRTVSAVSMESPSDEDLEAEPLQLQNKAPMVSPGPHEGTLRLPEDHNLEELEARAKGRPVGEAPDNSFEVKPRPAAAALELERVAAEAAQDVADEYGVGCSARPRRVWAETSGTNPTPLEYLQCYEERFGGVGNSGWNEQAWQDEFSELLDRLEPDEPENEGCWDDECSSEPLTELSRLFFEEGEGRSYDGEG